MSRNRPTEKRPRDDRAAATVSSNATGMTIGQKRPYAALLDNPEEWELMFQADKRAHLRLSPDEYAIRYTTDPAFATRRRARVRPVEGLRSGVEDISYQAQRRQHVDDDMHFMRLATGQGSPAETADFRMLMHPTRGHAVREAIRAADVDLYLRLLRGYFDHNYRRSALPPSTPAPAL